MAFRGAELEYGNFELILRGKNHVIKVTQRYKTTGNITKITISCNTTLCGFVWVRNSMEAYFTTLEGNMRF